MAFPDPERFTIEDVAQRWGRSVDYVRDLIRTKQLKALEVQEGKMREEWIGRRQLRFPTPTLYIEREILYKFEERYQIRAIHSPQVFPPGSSNVSDELRIANEAYIALYGPNSKPPKIGHKKHIEAWVRKTHPQMSAEAAKRIATIVNPNKKGGAPSQDK